MSDPMAWINDWLYHAAPDDRLFFVRYPPNVAEFTVSASNLLHDIHPAPLPAQPPPPVDPPLPPPVTPPTVGEDTLTVVASYGLTIRAQPSATSTAKGTVSKDDTVTVSGHYAAKDAQGVAIDYGQLLRVNGLKYADTGFIARSKGSEVYLAPKA